MVPVLEIQVTDQQVHLNPATLVTPTIRIPGVIPMS
jgi:hypothetical protein